MKLIKYLAIAAVVLVVLAIALVFMLYLSVKVMFLLLIILGVNLLSKDSEEVLRKVAVNDSKVMLKFKIRNIFKFLIAWIIYFSTLSFVLKGVSVSIFTETITCFIQLYLSFIYTDNGYKRIIQNYFTGRIEMILPSGLNFFPGIWFFYKVSNQLKIIHNNDNTFTFVDEYKNTITDEDGNSKVNIDFSTKDVKRSRKISGIEDFVYTVFINSPKLRAKILNLDGRRILSSLFLTIIIMFLSFSFVNLTSKGYTFFNSRINSNLQTAYHSSSNFFKNAFKKKSDESEISKNQNIKSSNYYKDSVVAKKDSVKNLKEINKKTPLDYFDSNKVWNNLISSDDWTAIADMSKNDSYVDDKGFFVSKEESQNYYPHVYVDGFPEDNDFFSNFFRVQINTLLFKDLKVGWHDDEIGLPEYIELIKKTEVVYRDIRIKWKANFKENRAWHLVSAGAGEDEYGFSLSFGKERRISINERKRLGRD